MSRTVFMFSLAVIVVLLCRCREQAKIITPEPNWKPNRDSVLSHPPKGMRFIKGGTFRMGGLDGTYDSLAEAKYIADSGMEVRLSAQLPSHIVSVGEFFMDTAEVTEKEWIALMGAAPGEIHGGAFPVLPTWYQAILFANAKSRHDGLHPVYGFSGYEIVETRFSNGKVKKDSILSGLIMDMTANGYRLPTEAEYEYATRANGYTDRPADNDTALHPAGFGRPNSLGITDLLDNAKEWVNDGYADNYYSVSVQRNPFGHDDTRTGGMGLMEEGTPEPGIFRFRSDLIVVRGPEWNIPGFMTRSSRTRQYRDPTDNASFRTVLQVR